MNEQKIAGEGQYLTFRLANEIYGMEITKIREVLDFRKITAVPRTPDFMKGVINLRGGVVPVTDLRLKFGMEKTPETVDTCIIIVEVGIDGVQTFIGALVDAVKEVIQLDENHIEPPPKVGTRLDTAFIKGMGKVGDEFIIILDIFGVFSHDELKHLEAAQQGLLEEETI